VGLKRIVPPPSLSSGQALQGSGIGLGPVDPGQRPGFDYPRILPPALKGRDTAGRARNCQRRAVRVGLKKIVPPFQGSGIGLDPVDPGLQPGLR
jgi:hypothetical protein